VIGRLVAEQAKENRLVHLYWDNKITRFSRVVRMIHSFFVRLFPDFHCALREWIVFCIFVHSRINLSIMFSGIVESTARVVRIEKERENKHFTLECDFAPELGIDQSVAHNGVCLTVVKQTGNQYVVTAMNETLERSNLGELQEGSEVNVERSMMMNGRLDGHIVQGHVDDTAVCVNKVSEDGSYRFTFKYSADREMAQRGYFCVDKGSVTVNGVSLTVCNPGDDTFEVCIIPYTYEHTNFHSIEVGTKVNIEFDIIGKYIARLQHFA
jgi:riboflavin synthase, alpha subunit